MLCRNSPTSKMLAQKADILAQRTYKPGRGRQLALGALLLLLPPVAVITAFGIAPDASVTQMRPIVVRETLDLPDPVIVPSVPERFIAQERVLRGDTVAALFERL